MARHAIADDSYRREDLCAVGSHNTSLKREVFLFSGQPFRLSGPGSRHRNIRVEDNVQLLFQIALVAVGSAAGGLLRWLVGTTAGRLFGTAFPFGTLIINLSGCLFLGWFSTLLNERLALSDHPWLGPDGLRLMIAVGVTGAYTTFSTYEWEANSLLRDSETVIATVYLVGSVVLGLLAIRLGASLTKPA